MNNIIESNIKRIEDGKSAIISALSYLGINIPYNTKIDEIASYISGYGVFRGTTTEYTRAYSAGKIPVGTVVIIDDPSDT